MTGATEALAAFAAGIKGGSLPAEAVHAAWRAVLDCTGVALAGAADPAGRIIAEQVRSQGGVPESVVWGSGFRTSAQNAALANGTAAHALDYDDTNHSMTGHPSVPILPAVVAVGERLRASGSEVLAAFAVGIEVECKLGMFTGQGTFDRGWHATATVGVIGAAAGVGRLLGLDVPAMRRTLGIAISQACGVRQNFGTMTKPFHAGRAAQSGVLAAELAARGFTASETAVEGDAGYWDMFEGALNRDGDALAAALGNPFDLVSPGINFKAYPCCASTHRAIDAALQATGGLSVDSVESVLVDIPYTAPLVLIHHRPTTALAAKFSLEYTVARALLDGTVGLRHFTEEAVNEPEVQALLQKVQYRVPEEWQKRPGQGPLRHARIEVVLKDGSVLQGHATTARGHASHPLSDQELETKFLECGGIALGDAGARQALETMRGLEKLADVRRLTEVLMVE